MKKFLVEMIWKETVEVEGQDRDDAVNMARHSKKPAPKLHRVRVKPIGGMKAEYDRRRAIMLPRWKQAYDLRKRGYKWKEAGAAMGIGEAGAAYLAYRYEEYLLNQK